MRSKILKCKCKQHYKDCHYLRKTRLPYHWHNDSLPRNYIRQSRFDNQRRRKTPPSKISVRHTCYIDYHCLHRKCSHRCYAPAHMFRFDRNTSNFPDTPHRMFRSIGHVLVLAKDSYSPSPQDNHYCRLKTCTYLKDFHLYRFGFVEHSNKRLQPARSFDKRYRFRRLKEAHMACSNSRSYNFRSCRNRSVIRHNNFAFP